jgi:hypothetical protein
MAHRSGGAATISEWTFYFEDHISVFCSLFFSLILLVLPTWRRVPMFLQSSKIYLLL